MRGLLVLSCAVTLTLASCALPEPVASTVLPVSPKSELLPASAFAKISNETERSAALFLESMKVIESPRCMNCHPVDRKPTQGEDRHPHVPFMVAGLEEHGPKGMACKTCHQSENVSTYSSPIAVIPGHPHWALAPASMAWQGKSAAEICAQLKDTGRNGGRNLEAIHEHMTHDTLVGWAWRPGQGRQPAPGTQEQFGALIAAWIQTGAVCPSS